MWSYKCMSRGEPLIGRNIESIKKSKKIWDMTDKSKNICKISPSNYHRILKNKITDTYKRDNRDTFFHK